MSNLVKKRRGIKIKRFPVSMKLLADAEAYFKYQKQKELEFKKDAKKVEKILLSLEKKLGYSGSDWTPFAKDIAFLLHPDLQFYEHNSKGAGRTKIWDRKLLACLWMDVFDLKTKNKSLSVNSACGILAEKGFWAEMKIPQASMNKYFGQYIKPYIDEIWYSPRFGKITCDNNFFDEKTRAEIIKNYSPPKQRGL